MVHGSLFSGIGGFDLAAEIVGWENAFSCEIDPFCNHVLKHHFPNETQYHDIRRTDFSVWRGRIDVLSGGFPCQPFSQAGKRKGTDDDRHLWPAMLDAIRQIRPRWVVGENVLGIVNWNAGMVFQQVCADLEAEGYQVQPYVLPACGVDAPHRRYRTFFIAYAEGDGSYGTPREVAERLKDRKPTTLNNLSSAAKFGFLPTPKACDGTGGTICTMTSRTVTRPSGQTFAVGLRDLAGSGLLPTPITSHYKNGHRTLSPRIERKIEQGWTAGLNDLATLKLLPTPVAFLDGIYADKNPGKRHSKSIATLAYEAGGRTSQLNPLFVEEMMGFPNGWILLPFLKESHDQNGQAYSTDGGRNP